jgi:hypothetical protein
MRIELKNPLGPISRDEEQAFRMEELERSLGKEAIHNTLNSKSRKQALFVSIFPSG